MIFVYQVYLYIYKLIKVDIQFVTDKIINLYILSVF